MSRRQQATRLSGVATILMCLAVSSVGLAEDLRAKLIKASDADFQIQGEYTGYLTRDGERELVGVQVVAWGNGLFDGRLFVGGLPGAGSDRKSTQYFFEGMTEGGKTVLGQGSDRYGQPRAKREAKSSAKPRGVVHGLTLEIAHGAMNIRKSGETVGQLHHVVRKSPTLGQKAPEGAVVLFDGLSAANFHYAGDKKPGQMTADGLLRQLRGSGGLFTNEAFGSCRLHLEFLLPFEPTHAGQGRSNSGCYLQGRYEVQILDSFALEGRENECGGVYSSGAAPRINMCLPPLSWQTYDIEFRTAEWDSEKQKTKDAHLTVWHNGVQVYDAQIIDHSTTASPFGEGSNVSPHYLQDHGHELWYRNIWLIKR
jgi:hypothetical protein